MDVLGGELTWSARIDVEQLKKDQQEVSATVAKTVAAVAEANNEQAVGIAKVAEQLKEIQTVTNSTAGFDKQKAAAASLGDTYDQSRQDLQDYLAAIREFNKEGVIQQPNTRAQLVGSKPKSTDTYRSPKAGIDPDVLYSAKQAYAGLDEETRFYIQNLVKLEAELASVEAAQKSLSKQFAAGKISPAQFNDTSAALTANEKTVREELNQLIATQKSYDRANQQSIGVLGRLREELKNLKADAASASTPGEVANINKQIEVTQKQISLLTKAGKTGFDELGNAIKTQEGLLQRLQRQATIYKTAIQEATLPTNVAKYNQKLDETNAKIKALSNAGRIGFDIQGNPVEKLNAAGEAADKASKKTNILSKSFGFIRQAAYLIPGIGIAGIFNLIGEAVGALITKLFDGGKRMKAFAEVYKQSLSDLREEAIRISAGDISRLELLRDILTDSTRNQKERVSALNEYNSIAAEGNKIDEKSINNLNLINDQISRQIDLIEKRAFTTAGEKLLAESAEKLLLAQERARTKALEAVAVEDASPLNVKVANAKKVDKYFADLEQAGRVRKKIASDEEVKNAQNEFDARKQAFQKTIALQKGFVGTVDPTKTKVINVKPDKELNSLLQEREALLSSIANLQRDSDQSGLTKEASAIDRIREKYDLVIKKVEEYNKKAKKQGVPLLQTEPITKAEAAEVDNTIQKQEAEKYLQSIAIQKEAFTQFEQYKLQFGSGIAKALTGKQTEEAENYVDFLKSQIKNIEADVTIKPKYKADALDGLQKALTKATEEASVRQAANLAKTTVEALQLTQTYASKKAAIDKKYSEQAAALERVSTTMTADEYTKRTALLNQQKEDEITALNIAIIRQSDIYRKLGEDTISFSREALQKRIADLKKVLDTGLFNGKKIDLTPDLINAINSAIQQAQGIISSSDEATSHLSKLIKEGAGLSQVFDGLASNLQGVNAELAEAVRFAGSLVSGLTNAASSLSAFKKAQEAQKAGTGSALGTVGAAVGVVGAVAGVVGAIAGIFTSASAKRKKLAEEAAAFQQQVFLGEVSINELYRQRNLQQITLNKLRLQGIEAESAALRSSLPQIQADYNRVLTELQKQTFTGTDQQIKDYIKANNISSLDAVKILKDKQLNIGTAFNFDELEKLFIQGQLQGKAKELFETLQRLKKEGADVDAMLEANKKKAQELFTGTTAQSLADSIREGLKNGYKSVADFAGNMEEMFRNAILSGFEAQVIEKQMQEFYDSFAEAAQSNGGLDKGEIDALKNLYETKLQDILNQFNQLESVTGQSFGTGNQSNSFQGQIKGITETTAELIAGQFGAMRVNLAGQLEVSKRALDVQLRIETNTSLALVELVRQTQFWRDVINGSSSIKVR